MEHELERTTFSLPKRPLLPFQIKYLWIASNLVFRHETSRKGQRSAVNLREEKVTACVAGDSWFSDTGHLPRRCQTCSLQSIWITDFLCHNFLQLTANIVGVSSYHLKSNCLLSRLVEGIWPFGKLWIEEQTTCILFTS